MSHQNQRISLIRTSLNRREISQIIFTFLGHPNSSEMLEMNPRIKKKKRLFIVLNSRGALSNKMTLVTCGSSNNLALNKIRNLDPQSHWLHFECSTAACGQVVTILDAADTDHFQHHRRFYRSTLLEIASFSMMPKCQVLCKTNDLLDILI